MYGLRVKSRRPFVSIVTATAGQGARRLQSLKSDSK